MSGDIPKWVCDIINKVIADNEGTDAEDALNQAFDDSGYLGLLQMLSTGSSKMITAESVFLPDGTSIMSFLNPGNSNLQTYATPRFVAGPNDDFEFRIGLTLEQGFNGSNQEFHLILSGNADLNPMATGTYLAAKIVPYSSSIAGQSILDGNNIIAAVSQGGISTVRFRRIGDRYTILYGSTPIITNYLPVGGGQRIQTKSSIFLAITADWNDSTSGQLRLNISTY